MKIILNYLVLFFLILLLCSCYNKSNSIKITDFSQTVIDTLKPKKKWPYYTNARFEIKGFSNDTIKINFYGYKQLFFGNFEREINMDYYGGINAVFKFEPLNATKGELKIKYEIY